MFRLVSIVLEYFLTFFGKKFIFLKNIIHFYPTRLVYILFFVFFGTKSKKQKAISLFFKGNSPFEMKYLLLTRKYYYVVFNA